MKFNTTTWGNVAQWLSAVAALGVFAIAWTGLARITPITENIRLREENARLQIEYDLYARRTWETTCSNVSRRAATLMPTDWHFGSPSSPVPRILSFKMFTTGAAILGSEDVLFEARFLMPAQRARFELFLKDFVRENKEVLAAPLISRSSRKDAEYFTSEEWKEVVNQSERARQAMRAALETLQERCVQLATVRM